MLGVLAHQLHQAGAAPGQGRAVRGDAAGPGPLVAGQDAAERGLAEARRRGEGHALAGGHREGEALVERPPPIAEGDVTGL